MNNEQRKRLTQYQSQLEEIKAKVEEIQEEEENKLDNMENFSGTEKYETLEQKIGDIEYLVQYIDEAIDQINCIIE